MLQEIEVAVAQALSTAISECICDGVPSGSPPTKPSTGQYPQYDNEMGQIINEEATNEAIATADQDVIVINYLPLVRG